MIIKASLLKIITILLITIVPFAVCSIAQSQADEPPPPPESLILTDEQGKYPLGQYMEILEDPGSELTIEDVSSAAFDSQFLTSQVEVPNFGFTNSAYWVRFDLVNETRQTRDWYLEQGFANTHFIDLYFQNQDGGRFTTKQTGILRPLSTRDIIHNPLLTFHLALPPQSHQTFYLRFQSGASMTLALTLWSQSAFLEHVLVEQIVMGIFFGVLIGLFFYNLFLFITLRETNYLYFVILLASLIFEETSYDGYLQVFFIPHVTDAIRFIEPVALPLLIGSMVLFADSFLELKSRLPRLHLVSLVFLSVWGVLLLLVPFISYGFLANLMAPWSVASLMMILISGFASWFNGYRPSRFFLFAWLGLVLSLGWVFLVRLGVTSSNMISENAFRFGYLWMAVCWSTALADRITLFKAETEKANHDLRNSEHQLSQILEGLPLGVVVYGKDLKPSYVNRRALEILSNPLQGINPDISAGRTLNQAMNYYSLKKEGTDQPYPLDNMPIIKAMRGESAMVDDIEADQGVKRVPLEVWASPILDEAENVESAVVAFQDITLRKQAETALLTSEARFRVIAENNFDGIAFMGRDREVLYASPSYQRLVGKTAEELVGESGVGLVHPDDRDFTAKKFAELLQEPNTRITAEYRVPHKDGSWIWVETFAINMLDNPHVQAVILNSHNITDRKQSEAELAEYRKHLETLVDQRTVELSAVNEQLYQRLEWLSAINFVNQMMARSDDFSHIYQKIVETINYLFTTQGSFIAEGEDTQLKILAHACSNCDHPELVGTIMNFPESTRSSQQPEQGQLIYLEGDRLHAVGGAIGVYLQEKDIRRLGLIPLQLRDKGFGYLGIEFVQEELLISSEEINLLMVFSTDIAQLIEMSHIFERSRELIMIGERNRLARDLHDSVTQTLFTASVLAEAVPRLWDRDREIARQNMEKLSILIRGALAEMRSLLLELRSGELLNQNLCQLLATLAEAIQARTRATISTSIRCEGEIPDKVSFTFYYVAKEALNNIIKHARAMQIGISLVDETGAVSLRIRDNGSGFDPQRIPEGHMGIKIMRERADQIDACLQIDSMPGRGTEVILTWQDTVK